MIFGSRALEMMGHFQQDMIHCSAADPDIPENDFRLMYYRLVVALAIILCRAVGPDHFVGMKFISSIPGTFPQNQFPLPCRRPDPYCWDEIYFVHTQSILYG